MTLNMPNQDPAIRTIAMPADTNPAGDIFGGWLMAQMDLAAGIRLLVLQEAEAPPLQSTEFSF